MIAVAMLNQCLASLSGCHVLRSLCHISGSVSSGYTQDSYLTVYSCVSVTIAVVYDLISTLDVFVSSRLFYPNTSSCLVVWLWRLFKSALPKAHQERLIVGESTREKTTEIVSVLRSMGDGWITVRQLSRLVVVVVVVCGNVVQSQSCSVVECRPRLVSVSSAQSCPVYHERREIWREARLCDHSLVPRALTKLTTLAPGDRLRSATRQRQPVDNKPQNISISRQIKSYQCRTETANEVEAAIKADLSAGRRSGSSHWAPSDTDMWLLVGRRAVAGTAP